MDNTVTVCTDWKLEDADGRLFGMCYVRHSPEFAHLDFKRGFPLVNPTHARCAMFALLLGFESSENIPKDRVVVLSTKHKGVYETIIPGGLMDRWSRTGRWPPNSNKNLCIRVREYIDAMPDSWTFVYIDRDADDKATVSLKVDDDEVSLEKMSGKGKEAMEKHMQDVRMRNVMVDELLESGARGSRVPKKKVSKKKKKKGGVVTKKFKEGAEDDDNHGKIGDNGEGGVGGAGERRKDDGADENHPRGAEGEKPGVDGGAGAHAEGK